MRTGEGSSEVTYRWLSATGGRNGHGVPLHPDRGAAAAIIPLRQDVTTVGRGQSVDVQLADPSVSMLHAEIVRRGPYVYVTDLGLSRNGTRVNGRLVARRLLADGDVVTFGSARCRVGGLAVRGAAAPMRTCAGRRARADPAGARRGHLAVPPGPVRRGVRGPGHGPGDRRRPGRHRGRGQAAPAAAVPEAPHRRGAQPAGPAGQRGGGARAGPAAAAGRMPAGSALQRRRPASRAARRAEPSPAESMAAAGRRPAGPRAGRPPRPGRGQP